MTCNGGVAQYRHTCVPPRLAWTPMSLCALLQDWVCANVPPEQPGVSETRTCTSDAEIPAPMARAPLRPLEQMQVLGSTGETKPL